MKALHRGDLFGWSGFDEARNIDFNSILWVRDGGNVVIDPMPLSPHDQAHLESLGGAAWVVVTNSDHVRTAQALAEQTGAKIAAPAAEQEGWDFPVDRWLADGDELVPGLQVFALEGSKTPGELALLIEDSTLVTGDLVRAHQGGALTLLPDPKLSDRDAAIRSLERLTDIPGLDAVLVGDGWPIFTDGWMRLRELLERVSPAADSEEAGEPKSS